MTFDDLEDHQDPEALPPPEGRYRYPLPGRVLQSGMISEGPDLDGAQNIGGVPDVGSRIIDLASRISRPTQVPDPAPPALPLAGPQRQQILGGLMRRIPGQQAPSPSSASPRVSTTPTAPQPDQQPQLDQTANVDGASIGNRIVDMTAQQKAPSRAPAMSFSGLATRNLSAVDPYQQRQTPTSLMSGPSGQPKSTVIDPDSPPAEKLRSTQDYSNLVNSPAWPLVSTQDKQRLVDLLRNGQFKESDAYAREVAERVIKSNPELTDFKSPRWIYDDLNVPAHNPLYIFPGDRDPKRWPELKQVTVASKWQTLSGQDRSAITDLMSSGEFDKANQYAQAVLAGKLPPGQSIGPPNPYNPSYAGSDVDNLVHSPVWNKVPQDIKDRLARQLALGDVKRANAYARVVFEGARRVPNHPVTDLDSLRSSELWKTITPADKTALDAMVKQGNQEGADIYARSLAIAATAKSYEGNKQWVVEGQKGSFKSGADKCNQFVFDVLGEMGLHVPGLAGIKGWWELGGPPGAKQWADSNIPRIGDWQIVTGPAQPGDVIAELTDPKNHPDWAHVGIVVEGGAQGRTASASTMVYPKGKIVVNDWGFRSGDNNPKVIRRYIPQPPVEVQPIM